MKSINLNFKIFQRKKNFKKGGIHINPETYWALALLIVFVIVLVMIIYSYFLFKRSDAELSPGADSEQNLETIDKARIDRALQLFSQRAEISAEIINSPALVVDPSR
jgi:hypothetical protein